MRSVAVGVCLSSFLLISAVGQAQRSGEPIQAANPPLKVTSRAVLVDVIVTDHNGDPVTGLKQDAFAVSEQGKVQTISFFEEHGSASPPAQPVEMPRLPPDTFTNFSPFPQPAAVNILLLDSLNTRMESQSFVHSQAMKFLKSAKPGTRSAIFTMGLTLRFIQGFNDDPAVLAAALNDKKSLDIVPAFMLEADKNAPTDWQETITADRELRTLANLQRLAVFLEGFSGRKNIIWFAEKVPGGFVVENGQLVRNPIVDDEIKKTYAMLGAARAAIYPVDARGAAVNAQYTAENNTPSLDGSAIREEDKERNSDQINEQIVAEDTGGRAFANTNGLSDVLEKVTSNSSHFYTISYVPTSRKMDGGWRKIDVKVAGGKYSLSYRRGYFAVDTDLPGAARNEKVQELVAQNVDPLLPFMDLGMPQSRQIAYKVRMVPIAAARNDRAEKKEKHHYNVDFTIDLKDLELKLDPDGLHKGSLNLSAIVYDRYGNVISREDHVAELNIKPNVYAVFQNTGVQLHMEVATPEGNYWLRTGIYDRGSHKVGTLEIPLAAVRPLEDATVQRGTTEHGAKAPVAPSVRSTPISASRAITVEQLEGFVAQLRGKQDKEAAQQIAERKLSERLSTARLEQLQESLPGERSKSALLAIADVSAFLPPAGTDLAAKPAPDAAAQRQILSRAVDFVVATTAKMPDFLAQKRTARFQDMKPASYENEPVVMTPDLYHLIDNNVVTVRYRNGQEEDLESSNGEKERAASEPEMGMTTWGIFGPMLETVMHDILKGKIGWGRWEQSAAGPVAVFRYAVPKEEATFRVTWCCEDAGPGIFRKLQTVTKYRGEISVAPETGTITRLVLIADLDADQPVSTADLFVEYGPVEIGGRTYECPTRSGTVLVAKSIIEHGKQASAGETYVHGTEEKLNVTSVSDTRFDQYHVFRSEMRIVEK